MRAPSPAPLLLALVAVTGLAVWLIAETPSTLVTGQPHRLGPTPQDELVVVQVGQGDSATTIGDKLQQAGVIEDGRLFRALASLMGVSNRLEAGDYEFHKGETAAEAVQRISRGITASRLVTIPEGLRAEEIAELLERNGIITASAFKSALSEQYAAPFLEGVPANRPEGFLFPATYGFAQQSTAHDVVQQLLDAFGQRYRDRIEALLPDSDLSLSDVVTLASIVEREAQKADERPVIASVFLNRLTAGMPLQADPTVQYALGGDPASVAEFGYWKRDLTSADLAIDSAYNTYVHQGLPPGPISNPGLDSILAVLQPAKTDYLYFVAREDGSHEFAATLEEHQRNVCKIYPDRPEC